MKKKYELVWFRIGNVTFILNVDTKLLILFMVLEGLDNIHAVFGNYYLGQVMFSKGLIKVGKLSRVAMRFDKVRVRLSIV